MTIDNDDAWHHEQQLERRRMEEEKQLPQMDDRERIERLNQAIAILKPIDAERERNTNQRITSAIRSLENLVSSLEK